MGFWKDLGERIGDAAGAVGGGVFGYLSGTDARNAAAAQAKVYANMSKESYRQGELLRDEGLIAIKDTVQQGKSLLSGIMNQAAAMGAVGFKKMDTPEIGASGIDVGAEVSADIEDLRNTDPKGNPIQNVVDVIKDTFGGSKGPSATEKADKTIEKIQEGFEDIGDVELAEQTQFASGSMMTNIGALRDEVQKARNTYIRNLQTDIYTYMLQGENYLQQSKAASKGGQAAQFNAILSRGVQVASMGGSLGGFTSYGEVK